ncbi:hypothetical protein L2E82_21251 [Cichorium intybus]|uniref:Uncharacterized protein n=1 Tax=Cichorium intybus TaxID=13427 RepID=A0ACB9DVY2_CICIN|nr:hypothetical protein L2E82_21251 [Cichorium intybus]
MPKNREEISTRAVDFTSARRGCGKFASGKEEVLKETKDHPLSTIDKKQLLDMMEMMEARHQQIQADVIKGSRRRRFGIGIERLAEDVKLSACWEATHRVIGVDLVTRATRKVQMHDAGNDQSVFSYIKMMFRLDHPFLQFPEGLASSAEYISRRDALTSRRVLEATVIDRDILRDAGLWGAIEPYLHRTWTLGEALFTCRGWDRIMATHEDVVYTELLLEFLSTIHFAPRASDPRSRIIRFRLGGAQRECNLREFGGRVGLYTPADLQHRHFTQFFGVCIQGQPERPGNMEVWAPLSNVIYEAGTSRESHLRDPLHRLMHRIVSTSIMQREGGEKVSGEDMTFFWVLLNPSRFLHLPYPLAVALSTHSTGASASSPLARGYFITRLARSYGILTVPRCCLLDCFTSISHYGASSGEDEADRAAAPEPVHPGSDRATPGSPAGICSARQEMPETRASSTSRAATTAGGPGSQGCQDRGPARVDRGGTSSDRISAGPAPPTIPSQGPRSRGWTLQATW